MKATAAIVEDEERSRKALTGILERQFPHIQLLGYADDVASGLALVTEVHPDILFLDIELGDRSGFDLLDALGSVRPHVIFTTGHGGYAVKAIRFSALDYLLKPWIHKSSASPLEKPRTQRTSPQHPAQFMALLKNLAQRAENGRRIALPVSDGLEMVSIDDILYCESDGHYTTLRLVDKRRLTVSRNVGQFEEMLDKDQFIRVHHSFLVNMGRVSRYVKGEGGESIMADGTNAGEPPEETGGVGCACTRMR
ncbi:MAG: response regulator transcription factor [Flavobacteriales bacterium]|nr:response regulator transcription factor [Flavobacteriales bacterium]